MKREKEIQGERKGRERETDRREWTKRSRESKEKTGERESEEER